MMESANTQLIEERHQLETIMQVQAENNEQKTEIHQLKTENGQLRNQIADERIQLESHKEENRNQESRHQREKNILQSQVERLTKELEGFTTVSINKKSLVSILHSCKVSSYTLSRALTTLGLIHFNGKV